MPGPVYLDGDDVTLRTIEREDLDFCQRNANDRRVWRGTGFPGPVTADDEEEWYETVVLGDDVHLLVCAGGEPVGVVGLTDVATRSGTAELGYWIAPDAQGNGYCTAASRALVGNAFDERRLHKVTAQVAAFNEASRRVLEKVGFEREGTLREEWYTDGGYVDVYRYGLLADEWRG